MIIRATRLPQELYGTDKPDIAVECLMAILLTFSPLAFGATQAWSRQVQLLLAGMMLLIVVGRAVIDRQYELRRTWCYVPLVLFVAWGALTLIPLPRSVAEHLSPATVHTKDLLLARFGQPPGDSSHIQLSYYPLATWTDLRLLFTACSVFVVTVNVYRRPVQIKRLLLVAAAIGLIVALIALQQNLSQATTVYGIVPAVHQYAGPFMNHSHFSQFINLSLGAAIALGLIILHEWRMGKAELRFDASGSDSLLSRPAGRILVALGAFIVLGTLSVFLSLSRMGGLSLVVAGMATATLLAWRGRSAANQSRGVSSASVLIGVVGIILAVLFCVGFNATYERWLTLRHVEQSGSVTRAKILEDLAPAIRQYWRTGTGLGTHEFVFPMFDRSFEASLATHAENEFAQVLLEMGVPGLVLTLAFLSAIIASYFRIIWRPQTPIQMAGFGLGFGLMAVVMHSFSDFGQHVPAIACLTAACCGLLVSVASYLSAEDYAASHGEELMVPVKRRLNLRLPFRSLGAIAVVGVFALCVKQAEAARRAERAWDDVDAVEPLLREKDWQGSNEQYAALLQAAESAEKLEPQNLKYRYWLNVYRWRSVSRVVDPATGSLVLSEVGVNAARRIAKELVTCAQICPTFGPAYSVAGQLRSFVLADRSGDVLIRSGYELAHHDPTVCLAAATLAVDENRLEDAIQASTRAKKLGAAMPEVLSPYLAIDRPDLGYELARGDRRSLQLIADRLKDRPDRAELAARCRQEAAQLLAASAEQEHGASDLAEMADVHLRDGDTASAIASLRQALAADYGRVDLRLKLAQTLGQTGQIQEAMRETRVCLRLRPKMREAEQLLGDLSVRTAAITTDPR